MIVTATPRFGGLAERIYDDALSISFFHDERGIPFVLVRRPGGRDQSLSLDHYKVKASRNGNGSIESTTAANLQAHLRGKP